MITTTFADGAGILTLRRPDKRNALSREMVAAIIQAIGDFCNSPEVRCIVLGAEGPVFCAGADIKEREGKGPKGINLYADLIEAILTATRPVIARVQGPALAGGVGIIAACHLAAAADTATFATPEVRSDLFPLMVYSLTHDRAGSKLLMEMALCEKVLTAREAVAAGLVNTAVPAGELDTVVDGWVESMRRWNPDVVASGLGVLQEIRVWKILENVRLCQKTIDALDGKRLFKSTAIKKP
jgi:methylglutaconyl-CoA hydratase